MTSRRHAGFAMATGFLMLVLELVSVVASERATTTVYVGRHFEVRDHDQPVKYVFNGDTRVARITGSLSNNSRIQRLRLQPGWNHCSMAVGDATLPVQAEIDQAYRWHSITGRYESVGVQDSLAAGTVLWIKANAPAVISLNGIYVEPVPTTWPAGATFVGGAGLEAMSLALPPGVNVWKFDATSQSWRAGLAGDLATVKELPPRLAPGEAIYVHAPEPIAAPLPDPAQRIAYYHQDHLGSSSVVTDAAGSVAEEAAYYPFGAKRKEVRPRTIEAHYGFSQKERDPESGLQYFGQRYHHPLIGKWISPDPKAEAGGGANPYAYVNQNPLKLHDPDGTDIEILKTIDPGTKITTYNIKVKAALIDTTQTKFKQEDVVAFATRLKSTIEKNLSGEEGITHWKTELEFRVVSNWKQVRKDEHVFRIVDKIPTGGAGEARKGGKLMTILASAYRKPTPDQVDRTNPMNKHYTWENYTSPEGTGMHELVHTAGLSHDNSRPNLMQPGDVRKNDEMRVDRDQIETMYKASQNGELNKSDPELDSLTKEN